MINAAEPRPRSRARAEVVRPAALDRIAGPATARLHGTDGYRAYLRAARSLLSRSLTFSHLSLSLAPFEDGGPPEGFRVRPRTGTGDYFGPRLPFAGLASALAAPRASGVLVLAEGQKTGTERTHLCFVFREKGEVSAALVAHGVPRAFRVVEASHDTTGVLHGHLSAAFLRVRSRESERATTTAMKKALAPLPAALVLLNAAGSVLFFSPAAARLNNAWCSVGNEPYSGASLPVHSLTLPGEILECAARVAQGSAGARRLVARHPGGHLRATVRRMGRNPPLVVVEFAGGTQAANTPMLSNRDPGLFRALAKLTPAERQVVALLRDGRSNAEMAVLLRKSTHTVKSQLRSARLKLGGLSRRDIIRAYA
ncbi:MAG: helix-turn-helix transcriptional regulator [Opitutales bacterium]|nr:helix-turn-helix transcriptional regulator [Opitutales bacterium]